MPSRTPLDSTRDTPGCHQKLFPKFEIVEKSQKKRVDNGHPQWSLAPVLTKTKSTLKTVERRGWRRWSREAQFNNSNNLEIIGIGQKVGEIPTGSTFSSTNNYVFLIFDNSTSNYHLRSFKIININRLTNSNLQYGHPRSFAILDTKNSSNDINLGNNVIRTIFCI